MGMSNSDKWKNIQHLEIAVGCIRSLMFFSYHKDDCWPIYSEDEFVNRKYEKFILELSYILDDYCAMKNKQENHTKKTLCAMHPSIQKVYYERDKNVAHKDKTYKTIKSVSLDKRIVIMKEIIENIREVCSEIFSGKYQVVYFPYDEKLRFCVYQVTKDAVKRYCQIIDLFTISHCVAILRENFGINIIIPGDIYELTTKMAHLQIKNNIEEDSDDWLNVYEETEKAYKKFYNQILPNIKYLSYIPSSKWTTVLSSAINGVLIRSTG